MRRGRVIIGGVFCGGRFFVRSVGGTCLRGGKGLMVVLPSNCVVGVSGRYSGCRGFYLSLGSGRVVSRW